MAKERLGVGIIGGGFVARFHIRSFEAVRNADVLGIVSRTRETAAEAAALCHELGVGKAKVFETVAEMVADPAIDALWICSPNYTRVDIMEEIVDTIEAGKGELVGVCCEKPLGRNAAEAYRMAELVKQVGLLDGYLENQLFTPGVVRGHEIVWARGAALTGPPYLARAAEEHSGPHMPWFWEGQLQGGGVLNDMMCHSVEVGRYLLTEPGAPRESLTPIKVTAYTSCLKWQKPEYAALLAKTSNRTLDYLTRPAEDFARSLIEYRDADGGRRQVIPEQTDTRGEQGLRRQRTVGIPLHDLVILPHGFLVVAPGLQMMRQPVGLDRQEALEVEQRLQHPVASGVPVMNRHDIRPPGRAHGRVCGIGAVRHLAQQQR